MTLPDAVLLAPVASADGAAVYAASGYTLVALKASDGKKLWSTPLGGVITSVSRGGGAKPPAVGAAAQGPPAEPQLPKTAPPPSNPPDADHQNAPASSTPSSSTGGGGPWVYVTAGNGGLYALAQDTGKVRWAFFAEDGIQARPNPSPDGSVLYVGSLDGALCVCCVCVWHVWWVGGCAHVRG